MNIWTLNIVRLCERILFDIFSSNLESGPRLNIIIFHSSRFYVRIRLYYIMLFNKIRQQPTDNKKLQCPNVMFIVIIISTKFPELIVKYSKNIPLRIANKCSEDQMVCIKYVGKVKAIEDQFFLLKRNRVLRVLNNLVEVKLFFFLHLFFVLIFLNTECLKRDSIFSQW